MQLILRWHGHACFEIITSESVSLLIDPHDGGSLGVGFEPPRARPHYVLVTHDHYDHNAVEPFRGNAEIVKERVGVFELGPFRIKGVRLPHDEFGGRIRGFVVAYRIETEGLSIVHLSDLGRPLEENEAGELGPADIVLAPAGGVYTLHPRHALEAAEALGASVLVPMHYWVPGLQLPLEPLDVMLRYAKRWRVIRIGDSDLKLSREELPDKPTIAVLEPPGAKH